MFEALRGSGCLTGGTDPNTQVATINCLPIIVGNVIYWLLIFAGVVALIIIIVSGFKFITSGGDPKQAEGARKTLTYAIIGLILALISFTILNFIAKATGVGCINRFGFTNCVPENISTKCGAGGPGFCTTAGQTCVRIGTANQFGCVFRCSDTHPNGYCPDGKDCLRPFGGSPTDRVCR